MHIPRPSLQFKIQIKELTHFHSFCVTEHCCLTFPKSLTSKRSKASNSSLFFMPNTSLHAIRKVLMFFRHRNWGKTDGVHQWLGCMEMYRLDDTHNFMICIVILFFLLFNITKWVQKLMLFILPAWRTTAVKDRWIMVYDSIYRHFDTTSFIKMMYFLQKWDSRVRQSKKDTIQQCKDRKAEQMFLTSAVTAWLRIL